jgi:hypothetical protein
MDEARRLLPHVGFAVYAIDPGGVVTLEVIDPDGVIHPFVAMTENGCFALAFPDSVEEVEPGTFMPPEGSPARAELAASLDAEPPEVAPDVEDLDPSLDADGYANVDGAAQRAAFANAEPADLPTVETPDVDQAAVDSLFD